jgi:TetR/AcrR family transcriptional regulator, transcriptional repressor for nem operon
MARPRSFDEAKVLAAARDLFWHTGYAATSLDDLVAATGLGKGSLYGAFGDKRSLFLRVLDDYCTGAVSAIRKSLEGPDSGAVGRLRSFLRSSAKKSTGPESRGCLLAKSTAELAVRDPEVARRSLTTYRAIEDLIVACLKQAQRCGDVDSTVDARRLGSLLFAVERGVEALGRAGMDEASLRRIVEAALHGGTRRW